MIDKSESEPMTISPPAAPEQVYCPEAGRMVPLDEAIRQKLRIHPLAKTHEVVAMFELDGLRVAAERVEVVRTSVTME